VAETEGVRAAAASIVKITGIADSCNRGQEGSGWVVARDRVVTNAHVVAGMHTATLRIHGTGRSYTGRVVIFDPKRDLAVIDVPGLPADPLREGPDLARGDTGVVAGFPLDGPYRLDAARVRDVVDARGSDIYGQPGASREVYSLYATVQPGNSGGPLLAPDGRVVGVIFAKSLDDASTGYALTTTEVQPVLQAAAAASTPVSTGSCVSG
jgi:S1-C subfamily serine protease